MDRMVAGLCPRCETAVALHEGRPFINLDNVVELWHPACFDDRDALVTTSTATDFLPTPPTPRFVRVLLGAAVGSALVAMVVGQWVLGEMAPPPPASLANLDFAATEPVAIRIETAAPERVPQHLLTVETKLEARYAVPLHDGRPLDELYPSLRVWTHPVTASPELMPEQSSRHFGAHREGIDRPECGEGHCGVDLDGPRGRPLVSVAAGTVVRIELSELGLDGRSGRFIKIQHDDGTLTAYMHMDEVADLRVGERVTAGQYIGTLGATAVFESPPHCHFALQVPNHAGEVGDVTDAHYVDPAPFLVRSTIIAAPARRTQHAPKPSS